MARIKAINGKGQGWHKQSVRHSKARKTGKAGGTYATAIRKYSYGEKLTPYERKPYLAYSKLPQNEKHQLSIIHNIDDEKQYDKYMKSFGMKKDSDGDGVPDKNDCQPNNPHAQDTYDLTPHYDGSKSFYGKAKVETDGDNQKLYSYNTLVAEIRNGKPIVHGTYSQTTLRHIKDFLKQNGFTADNSKQILKDYPETNKEGELPERL